MSKSIESINYDLLSFNISQNLHYIKSFTLLEENKSLIDIKINYDFIYKGNAIIISQIIYVLIINALYRIKNNKGNIFIIADVGINVNVLRIKNIIEINSLHIFKSHFFYNVSEVELNFYKRIMKTFDGDIGCSIENNCIEFFLTFPKAILKSI